MSTWWRASASATSLVANPPSRVHALWSDSSMVRMKRTKTYNHEPDRSQGALGPFPRKLVLSRGRRHSRGSKQKSAKVTNITLLIKHSSPIMVAYHLRHFETRRQ